MKSLGAMEISKEFLVETHKKVEGSQRVPHSDISVLSDVL